ncbi:MAG: nucleotide sugar dehydrogenase [Candidatus Marinimicrobia bacterium]|jgi:UDP-N-acetyl-D-glucosamine dehydrogenase|nr:nucleotide sugar dehydrogenase [Candidatus Neomarinimicrobiota bacterium]MDP7126901.1 nucleotide sugar dehydrogenase [Candidatus Neomarinimicrobiota bacterium]MDP7336876.1 nucleotide sugar dehydrogenase [Candidatus Neomarinimicrobiota bacterium]MDP7474525.1 nucleotide sugar dehydrogenase [Candidatus Neomarinimicrobiota bacterium]HJN69751.1 nucleotide sugar dehydrogenase [Candidatus Neomarinimicrobiota bacterium]
MSINNLTSQIINRKSTIGIIGLGYVGLPLAIRFSEEGFRVMGFDVDGKKVQMLNSGESYIKHIDAKLIDTIVRNGFKATSDFNHIPSTAVILICVPTPLGVHNEPDLSYIHSTLQSIKPHLTENQLLVLESTTYPGTTEEEIVPVVEKAGFKIGTNFFVGYSPEREDPGNKNFTTKTIPKVVSGYTENCLEVTKALYDQIVDQTVPVSSPKVAEMTKILENIHRAVNIGLVNELKMVADKMDIDIYEVINAAATKPFGFTPYYPGPGLGGHCIPIDPFYLSWKAKQVGIDTRFIELAGEINTAMPAYVVQKVGEALNSVGKSIKGSQILILGLAYKKNVDDLRESPSLVLIESLIDKGAVVEYSDPYFKTIPHTRKYQFELESKALNAEILKSADLVLLATDHDDFDYELIEKEASLIVDTRGCFNYSNKVIKA